MSFWPTAQLTEVVFESLWPGRSRYASLCKLAVAWQTLVSQLFQLRQQSRAMQRIARTHPILSQMSPASEATNLISDPFFFFPTFYIMKEAMRRKKTCRHVYLYELKEWSLPFALAGRRRWLPWSCTQIPSSFDEARISVWPGPRCY